MKNSEMKTTSLESLLLELIKLKKKGCKNLEIKGTLMCSEDGNSILASTEPQM